VRAVTIVDGRLEIQERPTPQPGRGQVLVRVAGAGLNRADLVQRAGFYPAPPGWPQDIPGMEHAGTVEAAGDDVPALAAGARVFGLAGGGAQATHLLTPAVHCATVPDGLDLVAMGGVPETFITAHDAIVTQAGLAAGEWLLVHAIGSGVGTSALQLAKALGARVIGTARTPDKIERARALGLDHGIVAPHDGDGELDVERLVAEIRDVTGDGAHVTLELVGGRYVEVDVGAAAPRGRIVLVGTLAGGRAELDAMTAMRQRLQIHGTVLRSRDDTEKAAATAAFARDVGPLLARRQIEPAIDRVLPIDQADAAYDALASNQTFGKVVLDCR
jgi:NADPH:quinone reductase-like Zn-dependent oxidoreductase